MTTFDCATSYDSPDYSSQGGVSLLSSISYSWILDPLEMIAIKPQIRDEVFGVTHRRILQLEGFGLLHRSIVSVGAAGTCPYRWESS